MTEGRQKRGLFAKAVVAACLMAIIAIAFLSVKPYVVGRMQLAEVPRVEVDLENPHEKIDWDYWRSVNADIIGWIVVPGTSIDYPIAQAPADNPQYYLSHDVFKNYNIYGCPYVDAECSGLDDPTPILYAHHMADGSMFSDFSRYADHDYAEDRSLIVILTPSDTRYIEVIGPRRVDASREEKKLRFESLKDLKVHIQDELDRCSFHLTDPDASRRTYKFVTCSYTLFWNERTIVYGQ